MALLRVTDTRELSGEIEAIQLGLSIEGKGIFVKREKLATCRGLQTRSALNSDTTTRGRVVSCEFSTRMHNIGITSTSECQTLSYFRRII